jgi:ApbE superfamily uncharacterized protein (UPF0280 family)
LRVFKHHFTEKESDITIISDSKEAIDQAKKAFFRDRAILENYIGKYPLFASSFEPVRIFSSEPIIQIMNQASEMYQVGPMAAVAGAIADLMLSEMKSKNPDFIPAKTALVENGGEIAIDSETDMRIALYAGENRLNLNIGFLITKKDCPLGIATSSATIGHAVSLGRADAATIFCDNATNADAAATKIANLVKGDDIEQSIKTALDAVDNFPSIRGALICRGNKVGHAGNIPQLFKIEGDKQKILKSKFETALSDDYEIIK